MFLKKKLVEAPLAYWEEKSYMMVIPKIDDENLLKDALERLKDAHDFTIGEIDYDVKGYIKFSVLYENESYEVGIFHGDIQVPEYYFYRNFLFTKEEKEAILKANKALTFFMEFKNNPKKSYHLQLKLALALIPDCIGVLDESAERMLPVRWVNLTAKSKVLPSAKDMFIVQAVQGKNNEVWLHTHGLNRCGLTELEILDSNQEHYEQHYHLILTYAMYLIDKSEEFDPRMSSAYIGRLINGYPVVVTCKSWTEGVLEYKKLTLGNIKDRENGHNGKTSVIFLYQSEQAEENGVLSKVSIYDDLWGDNPLFFFSDEETNRMAQVARERFKYVKENAQKEKNTVLIKMGLEVPNGGYEHIWFELLEMKGDKFKAKLTQEPYDIPNIHTGDIAWYTINQVTDWIIYTKEMEITPNSAYLLEK